MPPPLSNHVGIRKLWDEIEERVRRNGEEMIREQQRFVREGEMHRARETNRRSILVVRIIASLLMLWVASRYFLAADAVLVRDPCPGLNVTTASKDNVCLMRFCHQLNCSINCNFTSGVAGQCVSNWRALRSMPNQWICVTRNNTDIVLLQKDATTQEKFAWRKMIRNLGGIHGCPECIRTDMTLLEGTSFYQTMYMWLYEHIAIPSLSTTLEGTWQILCWLYRHSLITISLYVYAWVVVAVQRDVGGAKYLASMLPTALFARNAAVPLCVAPWLGFLNRFIMMKACVVLTLWPHAFPLYLVLHAGITVLTIAYYMMRPRKLMHNDNGNVSEVCEMPSDMLVLECSDFLLAAGAVTVVWLSTFQMMLAVAAMVVCAVCVVFVAPMPLPEQVVLVKPPGGRPVKVKVYPKRRARFGPMYNAQARSAASQVTQSMLDNSFMARSGEFFSIAHAHQGKLWIIQHALDGDKPVHIYHNSWIPVKQTKDKPIPLDPYQSLIPFTLPQGIKSVKTGTTPVSGWFTIVDRNDNGTVNAQCFYGSVKDGEILGSYENKPGMSGSPVYGSDGRLVAIHVGGVGVTGVCYVLPEAPEEEKIRDVTNVNLRATRVELPTPVKAMDESKVGTTKYKSQRARPSERVSCSAAHIDNIIAHQQVIEESLTYLSQVRIWTEEEYNKLIEMGFTSEQLKKRVQEILDRADSSGESEDYSSDESSDWQRKDPKDYDWGYNSQKKRKPKARKAPTCEKHIEGRLSALEKMIQGIAAKIDSASHGPATQVPITFGAQKAQSKKQRKQAEKVVMYDNQRTKKQPVLTACSEVTTSYTGHVKATGAKCGCTDAMTPKPLDACTVHCVHYWCEEQRRASGITTCPGKDCRSDYCKIEKSGN